MFVIIGKNIEISKDEIDSGSVVLTVNDIEPSKAKMEKFEEAYKLDRNLIMALYGRCECLTKLKKPKEALGILNNFLTVFF